MAETAAQDVEQFAPLKKMIAANGDLFANSEEGGDNNFSGLVDTFLAFIEKNAIPEGFTWADVKAIFIAKFDQVTKKYEAERPISSLPVVSNVDNYTFEEYRTRILEHLNRFEDTPFTLGRICELLREPRKHYDQGDKFLRAFEKCVTVTTTNGSADKTTNGNHTNGHTESGTKGHTATNGDTPMETDAPVESKTTTETNGHICSVLDEAVAPSSVTGTDSSIAAEAAEPAAVPEEAEKIVENVPMVDTNVGVPEVPAATNATAAVVEESVKEGAAAETPAVEGEKQSQKRPNEEEEDSVAKKVARIENGDGIGAHEMTHAVVGEPEVEPHQDEAKKGLESDATAPAAVSKDEVETPLVVGQEATF